MAEARKLDPEVEQELARLLSAAVKSDREQGRAKKQAAMPARPLTGAAGPKPTLAPKRGLLPRPMPINQGPLAEQASADENQAEENENQPSPPEQPASRTANQESDRQRASSFFNRAQNIVESRALDTLGDQQFKEDYDRFKNAASIKTPFGAIKEGFLLGQSLRQGIAAGRFSSFLLALLLAISKDLWDMLDLTGFSGSLVNLFITVAILTVVSFQGTRFKRWLIKKYLGKYILALMAEFIPGVAIFPTYTIMVLIIKFQNDKNQAKNQAALEELEGEMKKLKA